MAIFCYKQVLMSRTMFYKVTIIIFIMYLLILTVLLKNIIALHFCDLIIKKKKRNINKCYNKTQLDLIFLTVWKFFLIIKIKYFITIKSVGSN